MLLTGRGAALLVALLLAPRAEAAETCPAFFAGGAAPALRNPKLAAQTVPLCFDAFAVLHSGASRTPLYAAERLTRAGIEAARRVDRVDAFHEEERLAPGQRADLSDYVRSGFDRGHMAPAGDMPTGEAQAQSFSLANMVPQDRSLNRTLWSAIEESVRRLALRRGEVFVVTGPVFSGGSVQAIRGRVLVPTELYKAIYDPVRGQAGAYVAGNRGDADWRAVSLDELRDLSGLDVFPSAPGAVKARAMALPEPHAFSRDGGAERRHDDSWAGWARTELVRAVRRALRDILRRVF